MSCSRALAWLRHILEVGAALRLTVNVFCDEHLYIMSNWKKKKAVSVMSAEEQGALDHYAI